MTVSTTLTLKAGKALPPGNERDSKEILSLWNSLGSFLARLNFAAQGAHNGSVSQYQLQADCADLIALMSEALSQSGSFNKHLAAHTDDAGVRVAAELRLTIQAKDHELQEEEAYQVATVFMQQLVIACHVCLPGAFHWLDTRFEGPGAWRYEAQAFDARIFHGARRVAEFNQWPRLARLDISQVWEWLTRCETSQTDTAIKEINRVLFTLIKVAEQRHEYSARTVLLVIFQLEVLLDYRHARSPAELRRRLKMILGDIPEAADCLAELVEVRNNLFNSNQPVRRPPLICHTTAEALRGQLSQHDSAVESGTAMVLALLHDMISHGNKRYRFIESLSRD